MDSISVRNNVLADVTIILENGIKCGHPVLLIAGNIDQDTVSIQSLWPIRLEVYRSMETARIKNLDDITFQLEAESGLKGEEILGGRCFECNGSVMVGTHYSPYQKGREGGGRRHGLMRAVRVRSPGQDNPASMLTAGA
uniref:Uncharacterized protein n=1 Tax=Oryza glumipatula TaxID=40148 RepID=A0A0E0A453_9ORYZ